MNLEQRKTLEAWVRAETTPQRVVLRSRICLLAAEGMSNSGIARELGTSRPTVLLWRERFNEQGPPGLSEDAPHGPSQKRLDRRKVRNIVEATLHSRPKGARHWSTRMMAESSRSKPYQCGSDLGCSWSSTASGENFQVVQGQAIGGEAY